MRSLFSLAAIGVALGLPAAAGAGALQLGSTFIGKWHRVDCAPGTAVTTACFQFDARSLVPGLGMATESFGVFLSQADPACWHSTFTPFAIEVAGKGKIDVSLTDPYPCDPQSAEAQLTLDYVVSGGSGKYAGATGAGTILDGVHESGSLTDTWTGSLAVDGLDFDTTPPMLSGATSRVVRVAKGAKRALVRVTVTATDAVDGTLRVTCTHGSRYFPLGRTAVGCSATDTSGNTASATFSVTVRRR